MTKALPYRLGPADANAYQAVRLEGLLLEPRAFSATYEDELRLDAASIAALLANAFVYGSEDDTGGLVAIAGLALSPRAMRNMP